MRFITIFTLLLLLVSCTFRKGLGDYVNKDAIYVSLEGSDSSDGTIYTPVRTITKGIELMREKGYKTVKVTKGFFMIGDGFAKDLEDPTKGLVIDFHVEGGFTLEGGWDNSFTQKSDLIKEEDFTIIDGDVNPDVHTVLYINNTSNVVIDGFIIRNNTITPPLIGGGVHINNSSNITISDTVINSNRAGFGGGMAVENSNNIEIVRTRFLGNHAPSPGQGGALAIRNVNDIAVEGCLFQENNSLGNGGAIYLENSYRLRVADTTFERNITASSGGAIFANQTYGIGFDHNSFLENYTNDNASGGGGAIHFMNSSSITINQSFFEVNLSGFDGGAVKINNCDGFFTLSKSVFRGNTANRAKGGGALLVIKTESTKVTGNSFFYNRANSGCGGAINFDMDGANYKTLISNNEFVNNEDNAYNSTLAIKRTGPYEHLVIEGNNFTGPGMGAALTSVPIVEYSGEFSGHTIRNNTFKTSTYDFAYQGELGAYDTWEIYNQAGNIWNDAITALGNIFQP